MKRSQYKGKTNLQNGPSFHLRNFAKRDGRKDPSSLLSVRHKAVLGPFSKNDSLEKKNLEDEDYANLVRNINFGAA